MQNTELIKQFQCGDLGAFQTLYEETFEFIYKVVFRICNNKEDAEDLVQDAFIKVYESRRKFNGSVKISTWIYRIAVNHTLNMLKRKKRAAFFTETWHLADLKCPVPNAEDDGVLQGLLQQLKPHFQLVLIMRDIEGRSYQEVADVMNKKLSTIKTWVRRARHALKIKYQKEVLDI